MDVLAIPRARSNINIGGVMTKKEKTLDEILKEINRLIREFEKLRVKGEHRTKKPRRAFPQVNNI